MSHSQEIYGKNDSFCEFNFCEGVDKYPEMKVMKLAEADERFLYLYGNVVSQHIAETFRFNEDIQNMCEDRPVTVFPQKGLNIFKEWRTIVNVNGAKQAISFNRCM